MPRKESASASTTAQAQQEAASDGIDNYELPKSLVTRIAKSAIPENSKLQKDTVTALVKGSTVFINFLAATAHDIATSKQHKSVSASDVLKALEAIQFGDMVGELEHELKLYRDLNKKKSGKNGDTSISAAKSKSVSKAKGIERAPDAAESASASFSSARPGAKNADGDEEMVDVDEDNEVEDDEAGGVEEEEDELADDVDELEQEAEQDEEVPEEEDELVDTMAVEEEEIAEDRRREKLGSGTEARE